MQRQKLVLHVEEIIRRRAQTRPSVPFIVPCGEEIIFLHRGDIRLRRAAAILAREARLLFRFQALRRVGREHVVEGPVMPDAGHAALGVIDESRSSS